jgi:phosphate-selective porin OprO/OprP
MDCDDDLRCGGRAIRSSHVQLRGSGRRGAIALDQERIAELEMRLEELEQPAKPVAVGGDLSMKSSWASGLWFESPNKDFGVKVGGRTQLDMTSFTTGPGPNQSPGRAGLNPTLADTVNFRRARLRVKGLMYEVYDWAAEYDFVNEINVNNEACPNERDAGPLTAVTDLWMQIRELPVLGIVRIGNQKDPYGFEHLTSSRWLNFMERSFSHDAFEGPFNNGFLPGIQALNTAYDGRLAWQVDQFKNTNNPFGFSSTSGGSMTVGRLVYLPVFEDERKVVRPPRPVGPDDGTAAPGPDLRQYHRRPARATLPYTRFRTRGSIRNAPPGTSGQQPAPGTSLGTVYFQGGYPEVLYFLTGESRTYPLIESRFDRPVPRNNFYIVHNGGGCIHGFGTRFAFDF